MESAAEKIRALAEQQQEGKKPVKKFKVVLEQISEEVIEIEASDELEAIELAVGGAGELVSGLTFNPYVVATEELG